MLTDTRFSKNARVHPADGRKVAWTGGLWKERFDTCTQSTVPQLQHMFEEKDISHVLENFRIAAGEVEGDFDGTVFGDGDFYKWMESALYTADRSGNRTLLDRLDEYIDLIGRAQQPDGYISTKQIIGEKNHTGIARMGDINDFEVYNFGHLFTSACLHYRITGKDNFLSIAAKAADYLEKLYEEAERSGEVKTAVCPSHYMGLAEMYRTTRDERYLALLKKAVALRDSVKDGMDDNQDRIPLKEHDRIIGHAVRANYLYAGVADLCLEEEDPAYLAVLDKVWRSLVDKKLYVTGGCGALYNGVSPYGNFFKDQKTHQAYGYEYQLPNITAYNETCASLGGVFWAYRMFQLSPKAEYFDVLERMMLNTNLAAVSLDGKKFFYQNSLRREKHLDYELVWPLTRSEYILSYCCPPNLARTIAESAEYAYMLSNDCVYTGLYGESRADVVLENGAVFTLVQKTGYPYDGNIRFTMENVEKSVPFTLMLRIPGWVKEGMLTVENNGSASDGTTKLTRQNAGTYLAVKVVQPEDAVIELSLSMPVRYTMAHSKVEEAAGQVCVERGPLVFCCEGPDADMDSLDELYLDPDAEFKTDWLNIEGRQIMTLTSEQFFAACEKDEDKEALYRTFAIKNLEKRKVRLIPYFAWDNRGYHEMRIWFPIAVGRKAENPLFTKAARLPASVLPGLSKTDPGEAEALYQKALQSFDKKVIVLDDDPTGVQTVHDVSVYTDWEEDSIRQGFLEENRMFFILTNSRSFTEEETREVHRQIAGRILKISKETGKDFFLISRSDSTLRGHYPLETDVLSAVCASGSAQEAEPQNASSDGFDGEIICPFFPEGGRFTFGNVHYVKEGEWLVPAGDTEFARDKTFGYHASCLDEYVEEKTGGRVKREDCMTISLEMLSSMDVRGITHLLTEAEGRTRILVNAVTYSDLKVFAAALMEAMAEGKTFIARTAAAFTRVMGGVDEIPLLKASGITDPMPPEEKEAEKTGQTGVFRRGGMVLVGSHVMKTTRQLEALKKSGLPLSYLEFDVTKALEPDGLQKEKERILKLADEAIASGTSVVVYTSRIVLAPQDLSGEELLKISVGISEALTSIVGEMKAAPRYLIAKGGITSSDVGTRGLRVKKALVLGQISPGIPVWRTGKESRFPGLPYVIFPGNVGGDDTLREIVECLES